MAEEKMIIKKYSNRRLYDTHNSKYINLEDLTALIRSGNDFVVIDAKSGEDITKVILTQIIMEEEKNKKSILPLDFLKQLIKYRDEALHDFFQKFLSSSIETYMNAQKEMEDKMRSLMEHSWMDKSDLLHSPMEFFLKMMGGTRHKPQEMPENEVKSPPTKAKPEDDHGTVDPKDEITNLKKQLKELEKKLKTKEKRAKD